MAYTQYDDAKPVGTDNGNTAISSMRTNMMALRDAVISGLMVGWDFTATAGTGTAAQPQYLYFHKNGASTERIRVTCTYGTTGGEAGNLTVAALHYTADDDPLGSATWEAMGTFTTTYDSSGNPTSGAWS